MVKPLIYIFICSSISFCIDNINGYIYDVENNPIHNAEVYIEELSLGSVTDSTGYFSIILSKPLLDESNYMLNVSHIAYISKKISLLNLDNLIIYLDKNIIDAEQIVVSALGYKSFIKDTPVITHVITKEDIYDSPYNSASDIIEFVMPNVQRIHDPHGTDDKIKIQGIDNRFVVFMIDWNRISGEFAGNIDLSIINIDDIERIEIIRSGMSTLYGSDSMGGLINIITKKNNKFISGNISCNYDLPSNQSLSLGLGLNRNNLSYKLSLNYYSSPGYDLTGYSPLSNTVEQNLNYKINNSIAYKWNGISIDYMNQYYAKEVNLYNYRADYESNGAPVVVDGLLSDKENSRYKDYMNTLNIGYKNFKLSFSKELYNKSFYYPYYYAPYPNNKDGATITSANPIRYDFSLLSDIEFGKHRFLFGLEYAKETYESYDVFNQENTEILTPSIFLDESQKTIDEYSIVITDKFKALNKEFFLGLRLTKYSSYKWIMIPSLSIKQEVCGRNLRLNYSKGYRVPSIKELYYNFPDHPIQPLYGNPDLDPSSSDYFAFSIESSNNYNSSLEVYINNVIDMIAPVTTSNNTMEYLNTDKVSLFGLNINHEALLSDRMTIKSVFSYTDGNSDDKKLIEGISKYSFNSRIKFNWIKSSSLLFTTKYNSDKSVFVYNENGSSGGFYKLDSYWISDILVSFKYNKISIKCGMKNVFDYLSPSRVDINAGENLSTIDPGRRLYLSARISI